MNDNGSLWRAAEFKIDLGGDKCTVRGSVCGVFGIHDDIVNGVVPANEFRVSITHLPTGAFVGRARNGSAAYEIVEQLMPMADVFARAMNGWDLSNVANKIADIFNARDGYTNARRYA